MTLDGADEAEPVDLTGDHRWSVTGVTPEARSVSDVRRQVRDVLSEWGADDLDWALSQLLTEVVTNAVLHAGTAFDVSVSYSVASGVGRLRCEVTDASQRLPRPRSYSLDSATGRGLRLVESLATSWGVERRAAGKTVWFELVEGESPGLPDLDEFLEIAAAPGLPVPVPMAGRASRGEGPSLCALLGIAA